MGIKIGIDPSGTGTTAITVYENNILKQQIIYTDKYWLNHAKYILGFLIDFFNFVENSWYFG
ncbi:hypothetical protein [Spiroplasma endosymbiont of Stenodema calcarata]|uniref:hypothetical protein n=1 Tax=Spiroplasma endosymbiont of Stenodema calcarata TaxID=3139328 RepID=UPI003CCAFF18